MAELRELGKHPLKTILFDIYFSLISINLVFRHPDTIELRKLGKYLKQHVVI